MSVTVASEGSLKRLSFRDPAFETFEGVSAAEDEGQQRQDVGHPHLPLPDKSVNMFCIRLERTDGCIGKMLCSP